MALSLPASFTLGDARVLTVHSVLGEGSFGQVYVAELGSTPCALKVESALARPSQVFNEAEVLRQLERASVHGVPRLLAGPASFAGGRGICLTLFGESLEKTLAAAPHATLSLDITCHLGTALLTILEQIHAAGIVHRDLKPENIVWAHEGFKAFRLIDFGLAAPTPNGATPNPVRATCVVGTARYASLAAHDGLPLAPTDDVQSLACVRRAVAVPSAPRQPRAAPAGSPPPPHRCLAGTSCCSAHAARGFRGRGSP